MILKDYTENELSKIVVNTAFIIHSKLGPGLMESVYEEVLCYELIKLGVHVERQKTIQLKWDQIPIKGMLRIDLLVGGKLIIELKTVECLTEIHFKQTLTYLRLTGLKLGLLINFNVPHLKDGIRRIINGTLAGS